MCISATSSLPKTTVYYSPRPEVQQNLFLVNCFFVTFWYDIYVDSILLTIGLIKAHKLETYDLRCVLREDISSKNTFILLSVLRIVLLISYY